MPKTLSISDLIPERNTFDFEDGSPVIDMLSMEEFNTEGYADLIRLGARADNIKESLDNMLDKPEEAGKSMTELHSILGTLIKSIMPDIPEEKLEKLQLGSRSALIDWWNTENPKTPKALGQESQS